MLQKLAIKNYAIIDQLTIEPDGQLNTVTGETGAGKSIILGALSLILGERADTGVLINKSEKSVIEGYFDVHNNEAFKAAITAAELDFEDQCIIRREIAANGKSRAFINDTPVTLSTLNQLTSLLVDLHQQFDHTALEDNSFQMESLDAIAGTTVARQAYKELYTRHRKVKSELNELKDKQAQWQKEADYKQFLLDELVQYSFKADEIENAAAQLKQLSHSERIVQVLSNARNLLEEGEQPFLNELKRMSQQLQSIGEIMPSLKPLQERLNSSWVELKDIAAELARQEEEVNLDPQVMDELQQRVDIGYKLLKKHALNTTNELLELQQKLELELEGTLNIGNAIERLSKEEETLYKELLQEGTSLSNSRKKAIPGFVAKMNDLLALVGMPNARFDVLLQQAQPTATGTDNVQFMLDANKSGNMQPVQKAASGGEMSRIMLCIKSMTAKALHMPTLIFDEVDTGISGEAARQVGALLKQLGQYHQVICITHQPQVAARGSRHFYVFKEADATGKLSTNIRVLQQSERVLAIARMIGGEKPSDAAMLNARELVEA